MRLGSINKYPNIAQCKDCKMLFTRLFFHLIIRAITGVVSIKQVERRYSYFNVYRGSHIRAHFENWTFPALMISIPTGLCSQYQSKNQTMCPNTQLYVLKYSGYMESYLSIQGKYCSSNSEILYTNCHSHVSFYIYNEGT